MKKLFVTILIFILGTLSLGATEKATVTVRAKIISEELVVDGKNNKPLILDFGKDKRDGKLDFVLQYSGIESTNSTSKVKFNINKPTVKLTNENKKTTLISNISISKKTQNISSKNVEVTSSIYGKINELNSKTTKGFYTGIIELNITVIPM